MADIKKALERVFGHEGGYVNDPHDKGGETKYGISKRSYPNVDIKKLTIEKASEIYRKDFWEPMNGDKIKDQSKADLLFDTGVNMGITTAIKMAQDVLGVAVDGVFGSISIERINEMDDFNKKMVDKRIQRYLSICAKNPTQKKYLDGWKRRALSFLK